MLADMHCHTRISDGAMGLEELIANAKTMGLDYIAVTDHDSLAGNTRASVIGKRWGIGIVPAVEFSSFDHSRGKKAHILCYLPQKPLRLESLCAKTNEDRNRTSLEIIAKVRRLYPVTLEHIQRYASGSKAIFKNHIMHALFDLGYTDKIYGDLYTELFGPQGSCLAPETYSDTFSVLSQVRSAGGIAVLAHPSYYGSMDLLEECCEKGLLDGVEIYHPRNKPEDMAVMKELAEEYGLLTLGGTDFHGMYNSRPYPIGSFGILDDDIDALFALASKKQNG